MLYLEPPHHAGMFCGGGEGGREEGGGGKERGTTLRREKGRREDNKVAMLAAVTLACNHSNCMFMMCGVWQPLAPKSPCFFGEGKIRRGIQRQTSPMTGGLNNHPETLCSACQNAFERTICKLLLAFESNIMKCPNKSRMCPQ